MTVKVEGCAIVLITLEETILLCVTKVIAAQLINARIRFKFFLYHSVYQYTIFCAVFGFKNYEVGQHGLRSITPLNAFDSHYCKRVEEICGQAHEVWKLYISSS